MFSSRDESREVKESLIKIGFIVNPVAGMGGCVGLKGTDGEAYRQAVELGAEPVTPKRAREFLSHITDQKNLTIVTAPRDMGESVLEAFALDFSVVGSLSSTVTSSGDTKKIVKEMLNEDICLLVFVGGDGTARDVHDAVALEKPVMGVPSGVKMFSSVFAVSARAAADMLYAFMKGNAEIGEAEVLDINEEAFRHGKLDIKLYGYLKVPRAKEFMQSSKEPAHAGGSCEENKKAIARYMVQNMTENTLYLLGPGTTTKAIAEELKVRKTLLGIDAIYNGVLVGEDINESGITSLLEKYSAVKILVSPIGGQGFIFGRGNQEFSPKVLRTVGRKNIIVVATRDKIGSLECLRVDTGDAELDRLLGGYIKVLVDYNEEVLLKII